MFAQYRKSDGRIVATTSKRPHPSGLPAEFAILDLTDEQRAELATLRAPAWNGSELVETARLLSVDPPTLATVAGAAGAVLLEFSLSDGFSGELDLYFARNGLPFVVRALFTAGAAVLELPTSSPLVLELRSVAEVYELATQARWSVAARAL